MYAVVDARSMVVYGLFNTYEEARGSVSPLDWLTNPDLFIAKLGEV